MTQLANNIVLQLEHHLTSRVRHATHQADISVWEMDVPSLIKHWNDVINQLYGIGEDDDIDMFRRLNVYTEADKTRLTQALDAALAPATRR